MGGDKIFNIVVWYRKRKVCAQKHSVEVLLGCHKTSAVTTPGACVCAGSFAAVPAQLRPPVQTPVLFSGRPGPLRQWEPPLYPASRDPPSPVSQHAGTAGKVQRGVGTGCPLGPGRAPALPLAQPRSLVEFHLAEPWV